MNVEKGFGLKWRSLISHAFSCNKVVIYAVYTLVIMYAAKMVAHLLTVIHSF